MVCNGNPLLVLLFVNGLPDFLLISIRERFYRTREESFMWLFSHMIILQSCLIANPYEFCYCF
jgi:hypothetical protein